MIGVVVVAFGSSEVIEPCIGSLLDAEGAPLRIVVVDNASPDDSAGRVRRLAAARGATLAELPAERAAEGAAAAVTILRSPVNRGFAGGVNLGLAALEAAPEVEFFWILNPDSVVPPETPATLLAAARAAGRFGLMGGRTLYARPPHRIQSDGGGRVGRWTGVCRLAGQSEPAETATPPDPAGLDFISGNHMLASREFLRSAGPMPEDYFLFYEEVDWAARRGGLPIALCPGAVVLHEAGSAIGSAAPGRPASALATYFQYRNRMRFVRRTRPLSLPFAAFYGLARLARMARRGGREAAAAGLRGLFGLAPPAAVRARIAPEAQELAFGPARR